MTNIPKSLLKDQRRPSGGMAPCSLLESQQGTTRMGQEMYKLLLFDLLTGLAVILLYQFPRK